MLISKAKTRVGNSDVKAESCLSRLYNTIT